MKPFVKYGFLTGTFIGSWHLSSSIMMMWLIRVMTLGVHPGMFRFYDGVFGMLILFAGIGLGIRYAKKSNDDRITFAEAFRLGILISFVSALTASLFALLFNWVINPDLTNDMVHEAQRALMAAGIPEGDISRQLLRVRQDFNFTGQFFNTLIMQSALGVAGSLAISYFLKSRKPSILEFI